MAVVTVRDLQRNPAQVIKSVEHDRKPAFVTRNGRPIAVLLPVDEEELLDFVLANAPEYVAGMKAADEEIVRGQLGRSLDDIVNELSGD